MGTAFTRRSFLQSAMAGAGALGGLSTRAQTRSVNGIGPGTGANTGAGRMLFGFPPGSLTAHIATELLTGLHGHYQPDLGLELSCVPGGAGTRSIEVLRRAAADGGTVLCNQSSPFTLVQQLRAPTSSDEALSGVIPVAPIAEFTFAFVVGPAVPDEVRTMADYVAWVGRNPASASYGTPGTGSGPHFIGMSLARLSDLPLMPVAYQGHVPIIKDLLNGHLPAAIVILGNARDAQFDGRFRPLAVTSERRWPATPALPTLRELGLSDVDMTSTLGLHLPSGTPSPKVQELDEAVQQVVTGESWNRLLKTSLMRTPLLTTPATYADALRQEQRVWNSVVKRERFSMQD